MDPIDIKAMALKVKGMMNGESNAALTLGRATVKFKGNCEGEHGSYGVLSRQGENVGMNLPSHFPEDNPLTSKGKKIMKSMGKMYGSKKGKQVFYASKNAKKIKGVD